MRLKLQIAYNRLIVKKHHISIPTIRINVLACNRYYSSLLPDIASPLGLLISSDVTKTFFHKTETKTKTSVGKTETKTKTSVGKTETKTKTSVGKTETKTKTSVGKTETKTKTSVFQN